MKKSDSEPNIETPEEELKRLCKENAKLKRRTGHPSYYTCYHNIFRSLPK